MATRKKSVVKKRAVKKPPVNELTKAYRKAEKWEMEAYSVKARMAALESAVRKIMPHLERLIKERQGLDALDAVRSSDLTLARAIARLGIRIAALEDSDARRFGGR